MLIAIIAQIGTDIAHSQSVYVYGPLGVITGWFMWRFEKWSLSMVKELRGLKHGFTGLEQALLVEAATRPGCPVVIKNYANDRISKLEKSSDSSELSDK